MMFLIINRLQFTRFENSSSFPAVMLWLYNLFDRTER